MPRKFRFPAVAVALLALVAVFPGQPAAAKLATSIPAPVCARACVSVHESRDGLVVVTATGARGGLMKIATALVADGFASDATRYWLNGDFTQPYELVDGTYVPVASMDGVDEQHPLPGGGMLIIVHGNGYDVLITLNPDGSVFDIRVVIPTTKAK